MVVALLAAGASGCSSVEEQVEGAIRNELAKQGTVKEVDLSPQGGDESFAGHGVITKGGTDIRFECTAQRTQGSEYSLNCAQEIDETVLTQMENNIRAELQKQVQVLSVDLRREGRDRMVGTAVVGDGAGNTAEVPCTAARAAEGSTQFDFECGADTAP